MHALKQFNFLISHTFLGLIALCLFSSAVSANEPELPQVKMETSHGDITLELFSKRAPETVKNFLSYVNEGFYNGTVFHRVIPNFMIQGGGFDESLQRKTTKDPIRNEASPELPNTRGSIAMARTTHPHSATSQFFINSVNNANLNKSTFNAGYAVFGRVLTGMEAIDAISKVETGIRKGMRDVPLAPVKITRITVLAQD